MKDMSTKERILYAALDLISEKGHDGVGVDIYDRQPERETEVLDKIRKHFDHFVKTYGEEEYAC